jgi:hypothetical protein
MGVEALQTAIEGNAVVTVEADEDVGSIEAAVRAELERPASADD